MGLTRWETAMRRGGALVALVAAAVLAPGVVASASDEGRSIGRPILSPMRLALLSTSWFGAAAVLWRPVPFELGPAARRIALLVGAPVYLAGMAALITGRLALGRSHRVSSTIGLRLAPDHALVQSGPYAVVRHPMYAGLVLAAAGALVLYRTWATVFFVVQLPVLAARARLEDRALAAQFGSRWEQYRRRVPAWIPQLGA